MKITSLKLFLVIVCASFLSVTAQAKPDKIDGNNYSVGGAVRVMY